MVFSFLKNSFPEIYNSTSYMISFFLRGQITDSYLKLIESLEIIVKSADRYFNPGDFIDYSETEDKNFFLLFR